MKPIALLALAGLCAAAQPSFAGTIAVKPGPNAQEALQSALIDAKPGDTVMIAAGRYELTDGLSLDVDRVTVKGAGPYKTVLSFKGQKGAGEGLLVTSDDVVLKGFAVEDSKGDGIKSKGANRIVYHDLRVEWTGGPKPTNGAYGVYPVESSDVLIDKVTVKGASDAGIYVGQSRNIVVRNSTAMYNVAGIEIENSYSADVHSNVARHNTGGILVFDLPNLPQKGGHSVRVFRNRIEKNDTPNFAPPGNIVAGVPNGTGVLIMANRDVQVFDNDIGDNGSTNVLVVGYRLKFDDKGYNPLGSNILVERNRHGRAGFAPGPQFEGGKELVAMMGSVPAIVWDGTGSNIRIKDKVPALSLQLTDPSQRATAANPKLGDFSAGAEIAALPAIVMPPAMEAAVK
jgi:parallel beta-helix repeat protein